MKHFLNKYKYQILLFFITSILFLANYRSGTYLSGWDNLQTELNPGLAIKRAFFSVWEEYQSFGLTAGMAHAADLIRSVFLWITSFVIPQNMIRYFYHFLMLLIGGLGLFNLLGGGITAFLGALFYMLNIGTVQIFYLPFESFSTFFAFLPWGIWIFKKILNSKDKILKKDIFIFFIINILGTPSFYAQQFFVVYLLVLGCISIGQIINNQEKKDLIKKLFLSFVLILLINSFWILPQMYFLKSNGNWVTQAKANQIATEDTLYQNLEKGTLDNFIRLEGFYFDLKGKSNTYLFAPWKDHFKSGYNILGYLFGIIAIFGILGSLRKKKELGFLLIFILCALALLSATIPFSWLNNIFRQNSFINQIFRSPFTKFIIPYALIYSYFFSKGIEKFFKKNNLLQFMIFTLIIFYSLPSFKGYFISPEVKVKIPSDYFQIMDFFKQENKNKRIALLPDYTFWGWFFNKWGYNGSGFLWYGIEQPIVSRTFDVWSPKSESYFWEVKQTIEAENLTKFEQILNKYNIDYLIVDSSLIPIVSSYKSLGMDRLESLINQSQKISLVFQGQNLILYKVNNQNSVKNFIKPAFQIVNIGPKINLMADDQAYQENGDYITDLNPVTYYPFADLTTQTRVKDKKWQINEFSDSFSIASKLEINPNYYQPYIPSQMSASYSGESGENNFQLNLKSSIDDKSLKVNFEKLLIKSVDISGFSDKRAEFTLSAPNLPQKYGYLIKIRSKNVKGSPLFFYVFDETKKQSMIEEKLRQNTEYFILPNKYDYGLGYSLAFQNKSYSNYPSENILEEVSIYLFPYEELKKTKFTLKNYFKDDQLYVEFNFDVKKYNYYSYEITLFDDRDSLPTNIVFYQAFDPGWIAIGNGKILPHAMVNNWANGWIIPETDKSEKAIKSIKIIFWPQYLEFLGFILLAMSFFAILKIKDNHE